MGCRFLSESTLVKMPHCWNSHVAAQIEWGHYSQTKHKKQQQIICFDCVYNVISTVRSCSRMFSIILSCSLLKRSTYRGSYVIPHVYLSLSNELGKIDKMRGLSRSLSLFRKIRLKYFYAPNFEKVEIILLWACPSVRPSVTNLR